MADTHADRQAARLALTALGLAAGVRIVVSLIAGLITLSQHDEMSTGRVRAGEILTAFGSAGDSIEALLGAAAVAVLWWMARRGLTGAAAAIRLLLIATLLLIVARATGFALIDIDSARASAEFTVIFGFGLADAVIVGGSLLVLDRARLAVTASADPDQIEPLLFAVDRGNGEVFAFYSFAQARRAISIYSIEENEYAFYTDEGDVVTATADDDGTSFTVTDDRRLDELMLSLRGFAQSKGLSVEEPQEPTSYAVPVSDWQWLELWPGWLRPIGRLVRRLQS